VDSDEDVDGAVVVSFLLESFVSRRRVKPSVTVKVSLF